MADQKRNDRANPSGDTLKRHGDEFADAAGTDRRAAETEKKPGSEGSAKPHGDKLQRAVDKATDKR